MNFSSSKIVLVRSCCPSSENADPNRSSPPKPGRLGKEEEGILEQLYSLQVTTRGMDPSSKPQIYTTLFEDEQRDWSSPVTIKEMDFVVTTQGRKDLQSQTSSMLSLPNISRRNNIDGTLSLPEKLEKRNHVPTHLLMDRMALTPNLRQYKK